MIAGFTRPSQTKPRSITFFYFFSQFCCSCNASANKRLRICACADPVSNCSPPHCSRPLASLLAMVVCSLCGSSFNTISVFLTHLRMFHANEAGFHIQCGLQGCSRTFRNFHTYRNHVYSIHDVSLITTDHVVDEGSTSSDNDVDAVDACPETVPHTNSVTCKFYHNNNFLGMLMLIYCVDDFAAIERAVALWILKIREVHRIPLSVMDKIVSDTQSLFQICFGQIKNRILLHLEGEVGSDAVSVALRRLTEENIFSGLDSQSKQLAYFKKHFNFIVS